MVQCGPGEQETGVIGAAAADNKPWGDLNNKERQYIIDRLHKKCYEASIGSDVTITLLSVHATSS